MRILLVTILFFIYSNSFACLNIYGVDINGHHHMQEHYFSLYTFDEKRVGKRIKQLEKRFSKRGYGFEDVSDYAAYLLMAGRHKEGLNIFRSLQQKYPDEYVLKANLAVAYELNGRFDSALLWQKAAIAQNPSAHQNSEWIHLQILGARIALQSDSLWLKTHNVTSIALAMEKSKQDSFYYSDDFFLEHFMRQVDERLPFSFKEDKVFGKVFLEWGTAYENTSIYRAYYCYALAAYFDGELREEASRKIEAIRKVFASQVPTNSKKTFASREKYAPDEKEISDYITKLDKRQRVMIKIVPAINTDEVLSGLK